MFLAYKLNITKGAKAIKTITNVKPINFIHVFFGNKNNNVLRRGQ